MKSKLLIALIIFIANYSTCVFANESTEYNPSHIDTKRSEVTIGKYLRGKLIAAKGWTYNPSDQRWYTRFNRLPNIDYGANLIDFNEIGLGYDNFIDFELKDAIVDEKKYLLLVKRAKAASFQYRKTKKNYSTIIYYRYYLIDFNELSKFTELKDGGINLIKSTIFLQGGDQQISKDDFYRKLPSLIKEDLIKKKSNQSSSNDEYVDSIAFQIAPFKSKNIVHFLFMVLHERDYLGSHILFESGGFSEHKDFPGEEIGSAELFNRFHYEVNYQDFYRLFNINFK